VLAVGQGIELFKGVGDPDAVATRLGLAGRSGTHAIAHTRMATESAVTTEGSHPFSTGADTCLVHNGSFSNHNRIRETLRRRGETFQTENDSEVAVLRGGGEGVGHADQQDSGVQADLRVGVGVAAELDADFGQGGARFQFAENAGVDSRGCRCFGRLVSEHGGAGGVHLILC
jgi:hypothetical protein